MKHVDNHRKGEKMRTGFYRELDDLREEYPEADFGFMENERLSENMVSKLVFKSRNSNKVVLLSVMNNYSAYNFLHGDCNIFAQALHDITGFPIYSIQEPDWNGNYRLVHMYCESESGYIDIRGITDDWEEFLAEFKDNGLMNDDDTTTIISVKEIKKIKEDDFWRYEFAKNFIKKQHPEYFGIWKNKQII